MTESNSRRLDFSGGKVVNIYSDGKLIAGFKGRKWAAKHFGVNDYDVEHSFSRKNYRFTSPLYPGKFVARLRPLLPDMEFDRNGKLVA